jgi:hypothetical protein
MRGWYRVVVCALIASAGWAGAPVVAHAADHEPSDEDRAAAREAFKAGVAAARKGRWEDAREAFEQAHARVPQPAILLNLAGAQQQTGQLLEAAESYRTFLEQATEGPAAKHRDAATKALSELEERIPQVTVHARGIGPNDELYVGDRVVPMVDLPGPFPVNPGEHAIKVRRGSKVVARAGFTVEQGERATVEVQAPSVVPSPDEVARAETGGTAGPLLDDTTDTKPLVRSPWLWTGVGAAVAAGVITALALSLRSSGQSPHEGNFPPGTVTVP